jgi:hypothetical protein
VRGGSWNNNQHNARGLPQRQRHEQPQQQPGRAVGVFLPHLSPPCYGAGVADRFAARLFRALPPYRHGRRFRHWLPTKVCGPRRRVLDGVGESRPHGRRECCPSAINKTGAPPGRRPRGASLRFHPPAEKPSELDHHCAHVPILPVVQPLPAVREPQVEPQLIERGVCGPQVTLPGRTALDLGLEQCLLEVECGVHQALYHCSPVEPRKALNLGQQPCKQVEGP